MSFPGDYKGYITNGVMLSYDEIATQSLATYEPSGYTVPAGEAVSLIATSYLDTSSCSDYNMEFPDNETIEASYFVE